MLTQAQAAAKAAEFRTTYAERLDRKIELTVVITCQDCPHNDNCDYAWDHYNTHGDCLAMK